MPRSTQKAKVIVTLQDATLQAAVQRAKDVPVVFNLLSDPFAAGAGKSDADHLPNITGVYSPGFGDPEQTKRVELIKRIVPKARVIGVLFSPEEELSVTFKDRMTKAASGGRAEGGRGAGERRDRRRGRGPVALRPEGPRHRALRQRGPRGIPRAHQGGEGVQGAGVLPVAVRGDAGGGRLLLSGLPGGRRGSGQDDRADPQGREPGVHSVPPAGDHQADRQPGRMPASWASRSPRTS